ncbi:MAG TPA: L,D-transpeptidase [Nocardioidaceae bacterium]
MAPPRAAAGAHRAVRPRYARIVSVLGACAITVTAVLGAAGIISTGGAAAPASAEPVRRAAPAAGAAVAAFDDPGRHLAPARSTAPAADPEALPAGTGTGRRVVFDMEAQRVWLVERGDRVVRTYLVSGSLTDNLQPGTYEVYSTSRHAIGIDDSGTMEYMVRFSHGERAAIGFHDIPIDDGELVQSRAQLGTPQSHGCIRQWRPDARALWNFAPVGTKVVVTG